MASKRDYYQVLGVDRTASPDEIKKAYRGLARQYHPDVCDLPDAEDRFKEINEAYEILADADKKAAYDRFGHAGLSGGNSGFDFGGPSTSLPKFLGVGSGSAPRPGAGHGVAPTCATISA